MIAVSGGGGFMAKRSQFIALAFCFRMSTGISFSPCKKPQHVRQSLLYMKQWVLLKHFYQKCKTFKLKTFTFKTFLTGGFSAEEKC